MMNDEIVDEVRRIRNEFSARFNHDLHAMGEYLQRKQDQHKNKLAPRPAKKVVRISKRRKITRKAA